VEAIGKQAAFVAMRPVTGRTHQLRVHMQAIGTPILGRFCRMASYFGWCALALPAGLDAAGHGGLPVSLQVICRPHEDALALRVGHAFQSATDWHRQPAPGWE
jgi:aspartyl-tRNA(Asn)/glutamyl-tRNA(Gln) amidotransferase subunit A